MHFNKLLVALALICTNQSYGQETTTSKNAMLKNKCLNPPRTARKVENHIKMCQEEIKTKIIVEAVDLLRSQSLTLENADAEDGLHTYINSPDISDPSYHYQNTNDLHDTSTLRRRSLSYHPTLVPYEEKRIAGCLLHCVYAKNNAIDKLGWPTLDGLVDFYAEGVNEHGFFMATLRASNLCLKAATHKYHVKRNIPPERGESCDVAFDVFDCISDQITGYCLDNF